LDCLQEFPESRQARDLLDNVETEIVKDGVVGIGAAVGVMGIIATIVVAASKKR